MNRNQELDDNLGIVDDLNEKKDSIDIEKLKIIGIGLLLMSVLGYMGYTIFKSKEEIKVKSNHKRVDIKKKKFDTPPYSPPKVEKPEEIELPMTPFGKPKEEKVFHVNKNSRGSIINFNSPIKEKDNGSNIPNQVDINFYDKEKQNFNPKIETVTKKAPTIYRGGDYAIAGVSRQNPNLSLAKGAYIECTMITRIVSSYSGHTKCITSEDIYSTNGVTLLMEKGSVVTGHFKGGSIENGVERLFVIWDEVRTPNNVVININSQAVGSLGATGLGGYVDNHWGMRFGAAVLVSILDIGTEALKDQYTSGNNVNYG